MQTVNPVLKEQCPDPIKYIVLKSQGVPRYPNMSLPYPISPPMTGDNSATIPPGDVDNRPSYYPGTTEPMVTMASAAGYPMPFPGGCSGWPQQPGYPQDIGYPGYPAAQYPTEQPFQYPGYAPPQPGYPQPPSAVPGYLPQDFPACPTAAAYPQPFPCPRNGFRYQILLLS